MITTGTIANPTKQLAYYLQSHASNILSKSVLAVSTPQYAEQLSSLAADLPSLQVISACVDTVGFGMQRNGFSWCVFEDNINIIDTVKRAPSDRWTQDVAVLRMSAGKDIAMPLANTLFQTSNQSTLIANGENVQGLHIALPLTLHVTGGYRPLVPLTSTMTITSCTDNMLKTIDNQAAASFLENATKLINPETQSRTVFAEINNDYYKVTAGGGGLWSPRTRMLVLDTAAKPLVGDSIKFWLSTDLAFESEQRERLDSVYSEYQDGVVLECAAVQESLDEKPLVDLGKQGFQPVFGMGSEQGFFVDDLQHQIVAETLSLGNK